MSTALSLRRAQQIRRLRTSYTRRMAGVLPGFFRAQAARVVDRWNDLMRKALSAELLPDDEDRLIQSLLLRMERDLLIDVGSLAAAMAGAAPFDMVDPHLEALIRQGGRRIVSVNEVTRRNVQATILEGYERGLSDFQIANGAPADPDRGLGEFRGLRDVVEETYKGRADTIARTEVATASNQASADRYEAGGFQFVEVMDGPECGWTSHSDPDTADGSIRTIAVFNAHPLAHPNCRRVGAPWREEFGPAPAIGRMPVPAIAR